MYYKTHDIMFLVISTMDKEGFAFCFSTSSIFVLENKGWDGNHMGCIAEPCNNPFKHLVGATILNLSMYMMPWDFHYRSTCVYTHNCRYMLSNISLRRRVFSFFVIIGKREMVEVDYMKQIFLFFIRMSDVGVETEAIMRDEEIV